MWWRGAIILNFKLRLESLTTETNLHFPSQTVERTRLGSWNRPLHLALLLSRTAFVMIILRTETVVGMIRAEAGRPSDRIEGESASHPMEGEISSEAKEDEEGPDPMENEKQIDTMEAETSSGSIVVSGNILK